MNEQRLTEFEKAALREPGGVAREFWGFLRQNKKWWLLPILLVLGLFGLLLLLVGTGAGPYIYTLF